MEITTHAYVFWTDLLHLRCGQYTVTTLLLYVRFVDVVILKIKDLLFFVRSLWGPIGGYTNSWRPEDWSSSLLRKLDNYIQR
jgi:hypothetical protein